MAPGSASFAKMSSAGIGGGGFGGGVGPSGGQGLVPAPSDSKTPVGFNAYGVYASFDASKNDFSVSDEAIKKLNPDDQKKVAEARAKALAEVKLAKPLRTAKGKVEVQLWLTDAGEATLVELRKLGLTVDSVAGDLKVAFGTCDASALTELIKSKLVKRIEPIV